MTALQWDQVGDRRYESGVDRGVLYLRDQPGVPWNGLVSVTETLEREVKSYFLDGIKYLDHQVPGSYAAKLGAYTYPDELEALLGNTQITPGLYMHDQPTGLFSLSYRTMEGNDLEGSEANYKIHLVYNILAIPTSAAFNSLSGSPSVALFEWNLSGTPTQLFGIRPTSHISLNSRELRPGLLAEIEGILYGTNGDPDADPVIEPTEPRIPNIVTLLTTSVVAP
jgi:hypothetical protein